MRSAPLLFLITLALAACTGAPVASEPPPSSAPAVAGFTRLDGPRHPALPTPLYAGGQPTARDLASLKAQGVHTVIDLRADAEDRGYDEAAEAARLGLRYLPMPIAGAADITPAQARALDGLLDQAGDAGVLLHCASGNRVGALLALAAALAGSPPGEALDLGRRAGLRSLEPVVAERIGQAPPARETP